MLFRARPDAPALHERRVPVDDDRRDPDGRPTVPRLPRGRRGDRAYAWADNRNDLVRIDGKTMTPLRAPVDSIVGIATDPEDTNGVRIAAGDGSLWISRDGGERFAPQAPSDPRAVPLLQGRVRSRKPRPRRVRRRLGRRVRDLRWRADLDAIDRSSPRRARAR
jgi:hypothetical protein